MSMMKFAGLESAVKTAISEKALELEGWKELLKNKTWEFSKPNITIAKELIKPNLTALKGEIEGMWDPIEIIKGAKAMSHVKDVKMVDGHSLDSMKHELNDLYGLKANLTKVEKLAKKELFDSAEAKLDGLANVTAGIKDEAEAKLEALLNATMEAKGEVMDKVVDIKNATIAKLEALGEEKEALMAKGKNVTVGKVDVVASKKAMIMEEAEEKLAALKNVTAKVADMEMGKVAAVKNVTFAKVEMLSDEKTKMVKAFNASKITAKKAMIEEEAEELLGKAKNVTFDKKAMLMGKAGGVKKNITKA